MQLVVECLVLGCLCVCMVQCELFCVEPSTGGGPGTCNMYDDTPIEVSHSSRTPLDKASQPSPPLVLLYPFFRSVPLRCTLVNPVQ